MTEAPFLPRERLFKQQHYFQNLTKHTYLKGRYDVITSVAIPLALAASSMFMIVSLNFQPKRLIACLAFAFLPFPFLSPGGSFPGSLNRGVEFTTCLMGLGRKSDLPLVNYCFCLAWKSYRRDCEVLFACKIIRPNNNSTTFSHQFSVCICGCEVAVT
jgi:hypothetical protein